MARCSDIDPLTTAYVDGEVPAADTLRVRGHIEDCPTCYRHVAAEQAARAVLRSRADTLVERAPERLRGSCAAAGRTGATGRRLPLLSRASWPMALAATLVLAVTAAIGYSVVAHPAHAVAAQLTLDHLKCFSLFEEPAGLKAAEVQAELKARFGFDVTLPDGTGDDGLTLVGGRRCLYLDGAVAHMLYRRGQVAVSLFVLPPGAKLSQTEVDVLGHTSVAFERAGRTWVVLARDARADIKKVAAVFAGVPAP